MAFIVYLLSYNWFLLIIGIIGCFVKKKKTSWILLSIGIAFQVIAVIGNYINQKLSGTSGFPSIGIQIFCILLISAIFALIYSRKKLKKSTQTGIESQTTINDSIVSAENEKETENKETEAMIEQVRELDTDLTELSAESANPSSFSISTKYEDPSQYDPIAAAYRNQQITRRNMESAANAKLSRYAPDVTQVNKKAATAKTNKKTTTAQANKEADIIRKYKELLDMGAITQEEYEAKKKQLLGL